MAHATLLAPVVFFAGRAHCLGATGRGDETACFPQHAYWLLGPTALFANDDRTYFEADFELGSFVSRRLAIGGTLSISGRRNSTAYGY